MHVAFFTWSIIHRPLRVLVSNFFLGISLWWNNSILIFPLKCILLSSFISGWMCCASSLCHYIAGHFFVETKCAVFYTWVAISNSENYWTCAEVQLSCQDQNCFQATLSYHNSLGTQDDESKETCADLTQEFLKENNLYFQVKEKSPTDVNMNQAWKYIASTAYVRNSC